MIYADGNLVYNPGDGMNGWYEIISICHNGFFIKPFYVPYHTWRYYPDSFSIRKSLRPEGILVAKRPER